MYVAMHYNELKLLLQRRAKGVIPSLRLVANGVVTWIHPDVMVGIWPEVLRMEDYSVYGWIALRGNSNNLGKKSQSFERDTCQYSQEILFHLRVTARGHQERESMRMVAKRAWLPGWKSWKQA